MDRLRNLLLILGFALMLIAGYRLKGNAVKYNPTPLEVSAPTLRCLPKLYESRSEFPFCYDLQESLNIAAGNGDLSAAIDALQGGANANGSYYSSYKPLFVAVMNGDSNMVKLLMENGADPNATETWGQTPLHKISLAKDKSPEELREIIGMLVGNGADMLALGGKYDGIRRSERDA